jgi:hypothetical protein
MIAVVAVVIGARRERHPAQHFGETRRAKRLEALAGGKLVAASLSVIITSWFGSAPVSVLPLTVEVIAQIVAVPSRLTRPTRWRRPSAAGDQGSPALGLRPVG